jgi:branched-chain amino acid transport system substrate-binding protein
LFTRIFAASALLLSAALAGAGALPARADDGTIVLGSPLSLSGSLSNEGKDVQEGQDLWRDYVNAHGGLKAGGKTYKVEIKYYDNESNAKKTAALVQKLIDEDHVTAILGPYSSALTIAAAPVVERRSIPMINSSGAADSINNQGYRYTFSTLSPATKRLVGLIEFASKRTPKPGSLAIVASNDAFSLDVRRGVVESSNNHGIKVVFSAVYQPDGSDLEAVVTQLKAAKPDIVLNAGHVEDAIAFTAQLKKQGVNAKLYGYAIGPDVLGFRQALGNDANFLYSSVQWSDAVGYAGAPGFISSAKDYARAYQAAYGHAPSYIAAQATAGCLAFQYSLRTAHSLDGPDLRDALANLDVVTFFGLLKFDQRGANVFKPNVTVQIQNGKLYTVYPKRWAEVPAVYPGVPWTVSER